MKGDPSAGRDTAPLAVPTNWTPEAGFLRPLAHGPARDAWACTMPQLDFAFRRAWALALLAGLVASAFGVLLGVQVRGELEDRAAIQAERAALEPARALLEALRLTQLHRTLAAAVLGGDDAAESARQPLQAELDDAVARVGLQLEQAGASEAAQADWAEVRQRWAALAAAVGRRLLGVADSRARHGELIEAQLDVHDRLTERPGRALDAPWGAMWSRYRSLVEQANRSLAQAAPTAGADDAAAAQALQQLLAQLDPQAIRLEQGLQRVQSRAAVKAASGLGLGLLGLGLIGLALRIARRRGAASGSDTGSEAWAGMAASPADIGRRVVEGLARPAANRPLRPPSAHPGPPPATPIEADDPAHRG